MYILSFRRFRKTAERADEPGDITGDGTSRDKTSMSLKGAVVDLFPSLIYER